ncbi:MAG: Stp1/IreP family PP2C-type Ser/Thr phosphatase [Desulfobacula sp.]|nr:Stp1/IreP family PP2C-type Ser/Thr phosphatase [Desulfobacula sp.]
MTVENNGAWGKSHTGCKRKSNEDRYLIKIVSEISILAVADGMGGLPGGEIAAQIVIDTFQEHVFSKTDLETDLKTVLLTAEKKILQKIQENPKLEGMGTTATAATVYQSKVFWIHIGDSRLYLLRNKKIKQITKDHTFIQDLIDDGTLSPEQAYKHPLKNMLDQCLGCDDSESDCGIFQIKKNDRLLLCTDGLTKHLPDSQIESIMAINSIHEAGRQLIEESLKMGGSDNITIVIKNF